MSGGGAPSSPDYKGAAEATGQQALQNAQYQTSANRYNQTNPYGSSTWTLQQAPASRTHFDQEMYNNAHTAWIAGGQQGAEPTQNDDKFWAYSRDPSQDKWTQTISLSPDQQKLLDQQNQMSLGLGDLAYGQLGRVGDAMNQPFDLSSVGAIQNAAQKAVTDRLDPMWAARDNAQAANLRAQGLTPGMEAYDNAMRTYNNGKNDAYQQAVMAGIQTMPQTFQLAQQARELPLNEFNALRSGVQVNSPQFAQGGNMGQIQAPDYMGAANAAGQYGAGLYNANQATNASYMNGLMGLGGALGSQYLKNNPDMFASLMG